MPRKWTQEKRDYIIELYLSGLTQREVAEKVGSEQKQIGHVLRQAGVSRSNSKAQLLSWEKGRVAYQYREDVPIVKIISDYKAGKPITKIAEEIGLDSGIVRHRLIENRITLRTAEEAYALIDREKSATLRAESRSRKTGWGEDVIQGWLEERGESPDPQLPVGTKNIDLAISPIAVEVWFATDNPFKSPYCRERIEYLANRGWTSLYIWIMKRTKVLLPVVADKVVALVKQSRRYPSVLSQHWVIRGCGEYAATSSFDLNDITFIPPSKDCPHHSCINKGLSR